MKTEEKKNKIEHEVAQPTVDPQEDQAGKKTLKGYSKNLIFIFIILFLTFRFAIDRKDLEAMPSLLAQAQPGYLLLAVVTMFLLFGIQAWVEKLFLTSLGYQVKLSSCYRYSLVDYYFSIITPANAGGQPAQIYYMNKDGIDPGSSSLVMLLFNGLYHLSVIIVVFCSLMGRFDQVLPQEGPYRGLFLFSTISQIFLTILFAVLIYSRKWLPRLWRKIVLLVGHFNADKAQQMDARFASTLEEYAQGSQWIRKNPKVFLVTLPLVVLYIAMLYSVSFWVAKALGVTGHSMGELIAFQAAYAMTYECVPLPSGVGLAEVSYLAIFAPIYSPEQVSTAMLMTRSASHYVFIFVGLIATMASRGRRRTEKLGVSGE